LFAFKSSASDSDRGEACRPASAAKRHQQGGVQPMAARKKGTRKKAARKKGGRKKASRKK
jgi:hypothetical protein